MTKYIIRRTSGWYDEKPCDGAVLEELYCWNVRTRSKAIMQTDHPYDDYDDYDDHDDHDDHDDYDDYDDYDDHDDYDD